MPREVLVGEDEDRILGAHVFGPRADDVVTLSALAKRADVKAGDLKSVAYAYPAVSGDVRYIANQGG